MEYIKYKVFLAESAIRDIVEKKEYIIENFKYREYAEKFSNMIKKAIAELDTLPEGYAKTGFNYRGYDIFIKPKNNHLLFYTVNSIKGIVIVLRVLQDGMDWEYIIDRWLNRK